MNSPSLPRLIWLAALLSAAGCAGHSPPSAMPERTEPVTQSALFIGRTPIYAELERTSDAGWSFGAVTQEPPSDGGFVVRLNDLAPTFDTRTAECAPQPYRDDDRCSPNNPFRNKLVGVMGKLVNSGIAAGTGGKVSGIARSYTTEFDAAAFTAAVDEALLNSRLDAGRRELIEGLERLHSERAARDGKLEALITGAEREYRAAREEVQVELNVTGLTGYYSHDLDARRLVQLRARSLDPARDLLDELRAQSQATLLPCPATTCLQEVRAAGTTWESRHLAQAKSLETLIAELTAEYDVVCSAQQQGAYTFALACPPAVPRPVQGPTVLPVTVEIFARSFYDLVPAFAIENDDIELRTEGKNLVIVNSSESFVEVQSIAVHYNSKTNTTSGLTRELDLAPGQTIRAPIDRFASPAIATDARYAYMTPDKAARARFSFGLAVKYSRQDRNELVTLHQEGEFQVACAIENRLRPGSCTEFEQRTVLDVVPEPLIE